MEISFILWLKRHKGISWGGFLGRCSFILIGGQQKVRYSSQTRMKKHAKKIYSLSKKDQTYTKAVQSGEYYRMIENGGLLGPLL